MKKQMGFTLLELMIVVAIVGILASIAYPSYIEQIRESKRTDAKAALYKIAQQQEEYYIQKMSYAANITKLYDPDSASNTLSPTTTINSSESEYSIAITTVQPNNCVSDSTNACLSYIVTATAQNGQLHDKECSVMRLNNLGQELAEDDSANDTSATCW